MLRKSELATGRGSVGAHGNRSFTWIAAITLTCGLGSSMAVAGPLTSHPHAEQSPRVVGPPSATTLPDYGYRSPLPAVDAPVELWDSEDLFFSDSLNPSATRTRHAPSSLPVEQRPWLVNRPSRHRSSRHPGSSPSFPRSQNRRRSSCWRPASWVFLRASAPARACVSAWLSVRLQASCCFWHVRRLYRVGAPDVTDCPPSTPIFPGFD